jgi:bleomycin hydrolase
MNKTVLFALCMMTAGIANAQTKDGGISKQQLQQIEAQQANKANKALQLAIASNDIDNLVRNPQLKALNKKDLQSFSVETPKQSIHNQKSSGRCWMFSGLNVLRSNFALNDKQKRIVEFSQDYLFFYDQLEKANLMLQGVIDNAKMPLNDPRLQFFFKSPINDGGTFCGVADLAEKYGLVPQSAQPETYSSENTSRMAKVLKSKLREYALELRRMTNEGKSKQQVQQRKSEMLGKIYNILALTLGEPIKEFTYQFRDKDGNAVGEAKKYTPQEFYKETVGGKLNGTFVMVMNDPRHEYWKTYEIEYDRHTYDGHNWTYLNLPVEEIEKLAIASLKDGRKMYSSYDVGKQLDRKLGYLDTDNFKYETLFDTEFPMTKAERIATFESGSTHAMTLSAVDLDKNGNPVKWKVENSWGEDSGQNGCIIMTNRWFEEYMFRLVVNKKYASEKVKKAAEQKPTLLSHEDPLF